MPAILISMLLGRDPAQKRRILESARDALMEAFCYNGKALSVRANGYPPEEFLLPPGKTERYLLVEVTCISGRTPEQKAAFYRLLAAKLDEMGEDSRQCLMIVRDVPLENWGMPGGLSGPEFFATHDYS